MVGKGDNVIMKRYVRASSGDTLSDHFSEDDKNYLRLIYDVYQKGADGKYRQVYQERTDYLPVYEALYLYGDWYYSGAYTAGFQKSPDGSKSWFKTDVWIYSSDHPEMTHVDEIEQYDTWGPVGEHWRNRYL